LPSAAPPLAPVRPADPNGRAVGTVGRSASIWLSNGAPGARAICFKNRTDQTATTPRVAFGEPPSDNPGRALSRRSVVQERPRARVRSGSMARRAATGAERSRAVASWLIAATICQWVSHWSARIPENARSQGAL